LPASAAARIGSRGVMSPTSALLALRTYGHGSVEDHAGHGAAADRHAMATAPQASSAW
jgi:hypothetical protein